MYKKLLILVVMSVAVTSCASWFSSSKEIPDAPAVGGKQDSSDMLFGQAESGTESAVAPSTVDNKAVPTAPVNASASK